MRHDKYIKMCLRLIEKNKNYRYNHVAVVIKSGRIISIGYNKNEKPGKSKYSFYGSKGFHAELSALYKLKPESINKATLYTAAISKSGNIIYSCPCPECRNLLKKYNFKEIIYCNEYGKPQKLVI